MIGRELRIAIANGLSLALLIGTGTYLVFGNADLEHSFPIAREVTTSFGPAGLPVYRGAAGAARNASCRQ